MTNQTEDLKNNNTAYDARFSNILGGEEYDDLLIALGFYNELQAETGQALKDYIQTNCQNLSSIKVLEAGPGTGITTLELLKTDPRVEIVSIDNEPKMLEAVKDRFSKIAELKDRVQFVMSDILEFLESSPNESFDAFASVYTLHNFPTDFRRKVIELIAKKLKQGGVFINGDKYAENDAEHKIDIATEIKSYDKFDVAADEAEKSGNKDRADHLRTLKREWIAHTWEDEKNKITVDEQNEMLQELGFKDVEWKKRYDLVTTVRAVKA